MPDKEDKWQLIPEFMRVSHWVWIIPFRIVASSNNRLTHSITLSILAFARSWRQTKKFAAM